MGATAETLAERYEIPREAQDEFALESQRKAEAAQKAGRFKDEIAPVTVEGPQGRGRHRHATSTRAPSTTVADMAKLPAGLQEGRHACTPATARASPTAPPRCWSPRPASRRSAACTILARLAGAAMAGVDPKIMGIGPVPAVEHAARAHAA